MFYFHLFLETGLFYLPAKIRNIMYVCKLIGQKPHFYLESSIKFRTFALPQRNNSQSSKQGKREKKREGCEALPIDGYLSGKREQALVPITYS